MTRNAFNVNGSGKMVGLIIYLAGLFCAVWCVIDIFRKHMDVTPKILVSIAVLATSWAGILMYYFWAGRRMEEWFGA